MKLDYDETVIFRPKRYLFTIIIHWCFLIIALYGAILVIQLNFLPILTIPLFFIYMSIHRLFSKVFLTNKRIIYRDIFYIYKAICLKDIIYIAQYGPATSTNDLYGFFYDFQNIKYLGFKITSRLFENNLAVPDGETFKEKILDYIKENIKNNNLNQELIKKKISYKLGIIS